MDFIGNAGTSEFLEDKQKWDAGSGGRYLKDPGSYGLKIVAVEPGKVLEKHDSFRSYKLVLEANNGEQMNLFLQLPTGEKPPVWKPFIWNKLRDFLGAYGISFNTTDDIAAMVPLFKDPSILKGASFSAVVWYPKAWIKYQGKDENNVKQYVIATKAGDLKNGEGYFAEYKDAEQYAVDNKIELSKFLEIKSYESGSGQGLKLGATQAADDLDDIPF